MSEPVYTLAIDPSISSSGVALFEDSKLIACARIKAKRSDADLMVRCLDMSDRIVEWLVPKKIKPIRVVAERPQIYPHSKGDPNDLIPMFGVIQGVVGILHIVNAACQRGMFLESYLPAEWIGQLPKTKIGNARMSPRAQYIANKLSDDELRIFLDTDSHDAIDAIGVGLFSVGRLKRERVFSGATDD